MFHREPLLVVTTGKAENVTFVFITEEVTFDFGGQTLVVQSAQLLLVLDLDCFLVVVELVLQWPGFELF